jgi:hypothetical protein
MYNITNRRNNKIKFQNNQFAKYTYFLEERRKNPGRSAEPVLDRYKQESPEDHRYQRHGEPPRPKMVQSIRALALGAHFIYLVVNLTPFTPTF